MLDKIMYSIIAIGCLAIVIGLAWVRFMVHDDDRIQQYDIEYEWMPAGNERLFDDSDIVIESRHHSDDFLTDWEAEWNREAIRIEFDRLMFLNDINATSALWQLEIEKGVKNQWQEDSMSVGQ